MTDDHESQQILHRWISGYEGKYSVTPCGKVYSHETHSHNKNLPSFSLRKGRWLKQRTNPDGYKTVILGGGSTKNQVTYSVHRLVAMAYICNPKGLSDVNHIDKIRSHNDVKNLGWLSHEENVIYSSAKRYLVTHPSGMKEKITNMSEFCKKYELSKGYMSQVVSGKRKIHKGFSAEITGWTYYE